MWTRPSTRSSLHPRDHTSARAQGPSGPRVADAMARTLPRARCSPSFAPSFLLLLPVLVSPSLVSLDRRQPWPPEELPIHQNSQPQPHRIKQPEDLPRPAEGADRSCPPSAVARKHWQLAGASINHQDLLELAITRSAAAFNFTGPDLSCHAQRLPVASH